MIMKLDKRLSFKDERGVKTLYALTKIGISS